MGSILSSDIEPSIFMPIYYHYRFMAKKFISKFNDKDNHCENGRIIINIDDDYLDSGDYIFSFDGIKPFITNIIENYDIVILNNTIEFTPKHKNSYRKSIDDQ